MISLDRGMFARAYSVNCFTSILIFIDGLCWLVCKTINKKTKSWASSFDLKVLKGSLSKNLNEKRSIMRLTTYESTPASLNVVKKRLIECSTLPSLKSILSKKASIILLARSSLPPITSITLDIWTSLEYARILAATSAGVLGSA